MQLAIVRPSALSGIARPAPSLPLARRLLWVASIGEGGVVGNLPDHPDIRAIFAAGQELGADGVLEHGTADLFGPAQPVPPAALSCASNGALSRLAVPMSLLLGQPATLHSLRLPDSALAWLDGAASAIGVRALKTPGRLEVSGVVRGDALILADRAGAFWAPSLLLAAPLGDSPLSLALDEFTAQQPSVQMSMRTLARLGTYFSWEESELMLTTVPGQSYPEINVDVEADWRTGSYLLGALLLAGRGACVLPRDSVQSERGFWLGLESAGLLRWNQAEDAIWAQCGEPLPLPEHLDPRPYPSLIPLLLVLATQAAQPVRIEPLYPLSPRSRHRLVFTAQQLALLGADIHIEEGFVEVKPGPITGGDALAGGDSRIAMALALAGLIAKEPVRISGAQVAQRSDADFWSDLQALGALVDLDTLPDATPDASSP